MAHDPNDNYFSYYGQFTHQENMLRDTIRTSTYQNAILNNSEVFHDKIVMDLGAGSGILSYFACHAGAKKVFAVEASRMAKNIEKMCKNNAKYRDKIVVINKKIEDVEKEEIGKVDIIISEPMGVLLVHERMIESYLLARDLYLKDDGFLFPNAGLIYLAPVTDVLLWSQTQAKARFWNNTDFMGVDLTPLENDAREEYFAMPVVGGFDPRTMMADAVIHFMDFNSTSLEQLKHFKIPLYWKSNFTGLIHCIGGWFDVTFIPPNANPNNTFQLSTHPNLERTHWHQIRFLLREPLAVNYGQEVRGIMSFAVNSARSYDITCELKCGDVVRHDNWHLQDQNYMYSWEGTTQQEYHPELSNLYTAPQEPNGQVMEM